MQPGLLGAISPDEQRGLLEPYERRPNPMAGLLGGYNPQMIRPTPATLERFNEAMHYAGPFMGAIRTMPAPGWNAGIKSYDLGVNPTRKELMELLRDEDTLRVLMSGDDLYAWPANAALHSDVGAALGLSPKGTRHGLIGREQVTGVRQ